MNFTKRTLNKFISIQNCLINKALVLIYHRVIDLELDPQLLTVSPENFEAQIKYLSQNYNVISLKQLVIDLSKRKIDNKSIVITFDDGYFDNFKFAKPILEKYNVPATFFISTGYIESNREYWWDKLEYIFLEKCPKKKLVIDIDSKKFERDINSEEDAFSVYNELHPLLKRINHIERDKIISKLILWSEKFLERRDNYRSMCKDEIKVLGTSKLIDIGAHTVNHPVLSVESSIIQKKEIINSKRELELIIGKNVTLFSYPFGGKNDFNNETEQILRDSNFIAGIANIQGCVTKKTNEWEIPRFLIRNWDLDVFSQKLDFAFRYN